MTEIQNKKLNQIIGKAKCNKCIIFMQLPYPQLNQQSSCKYFPKTTKEIYLLIVMTMKDPTTIRTVCKVSVYITALRPPVTKPKKIAYS